MFEIREARSEDEIDVAALAEEFQSSATFDKNKFKSIWSEKLKDPNSYIGVATLNGVIMGYVSGYMHLTFYASGAVFWVDEIFVKEEKRREGAGSMLMKSIDSWIGGRECKLIALATSGSKDFYPEIGFRETAGYFKKQL